MRPEQLKKINNMREIDAWKFHVNFSYVNSKIDCEHSDCKPFDWPYNHRINTQAEGDPEAGAEKISVGVACHGKDGKAMAEIYPNLAGQSAVYLESSLKAYQEGQRQGGMLSMMTPQAAQLSDKDIADISAYYSQQVP